MNDFKQWVSRPIIDGVIWRLPPSLWWKFSTAYLLIKAWQTGLPQGIHSDAFKNCYTKGRALGWQFGSKIRVGITRNWSGSVLLDVRNPWTMFSEKYAQQQFSPLLFLFINVVNVPNSFIEIVDSFEN